MMSCGSANELWPQEAEVPKDVQIESPPAQFADHPWRWRTSSVTNGMMPVLRRIKPYGCVWK